jgi:hypothetical protein
MTSADEARFIALWNAGTETAAIGQQLGLKATTAQSRAYRLQQRGLIQPRPQGGGYPSPRAKARQDGAPAPARAPAPAEPPAPTRTPGTIKQWTVRLSHPLIEAVKAQATTEGKEPSHLVEELLWHALTDRQSSMSERREP